MKKTFNLRSLLSIFLVLAMMLTLLCSCSGKDDKKDDNSDKSKDEGASSLICALLGGTRSAQIDFSFDVLVDEGGAWGAYADIDADASLIFSINTKGGVDAKIDMKGEGVMQKGMPKTKIDATVLYLVDGKLYTYDTDMKAYMVSEAVSADDIKAFEKTLMSALKENLDGVDVEELRKELTSIMASAFDIKLNGASLDIDIMPTYNAIASYFLDLDLRNDSLGDIVDDIIALLGAEGSYKDGLEGAESILGLTVDELIDTIDALLVEEAGMSLSDLYEAIVTNKDLLDAVNSLPAEAGDLANMFKELGNVSFDELIDSFEIRGDTLYDLMVSASEADEIPSLEDFINGLDEFLSMPLSELESVIGATPFSDAQDFFESFGLTELDFSLDLKVNSSFKFESFTFEGNFVCEYEDAKYDMHIKCSISKLSKDPVKITVPKDIKTFDMEDLLGEF
ncbi:MAG: hypothetical protein IJZ03_05590 [Clostridia bacterium]|nr:hypothetical protein [Clostridia bacterium]